jgi:hypothetical protein
MGFSGDGHIPQRCEKNSSFYYIMTVDSQYDGGVLEDDVARSCLKRIWIFLLRKNGSVTLLLF